LATVLACGSVRGQAAACGNVRRVGMCGMEWDGDGNVRLFPPHGHCHRRVAGVGTEEKGGGNRVIWSYCSSHHLPACIYGIFGGKKNGSVKLLTQLRMHKKAR
jgi:hypothetical protein